MKSSPHRSQRVARELQKQVGLWLARDSGDDRFRTLAITRVQVSPDLGFARFYYVLAETDPETPKKVREALEAARGRIRHEIGRGGRLRVVPEIRFEYDTELESVRRVETLLATLDPPPDG
jgi:ribosome-binding factor A